MRPVLSDAQGVPLEAVQDVLGQHHVGALGGWEHREGDVDAPWHRDELDHLPPMGSCCTRSSPARAGAAAVDLDVGVPPLRAPHRDMLSSAEVTRCVLDDEREDQLWT